MVKVPKNKINNYIPNLYGFLITKSALGTNEHHKELMRKFQNQQKKKRIKSYEKRVNQKFSF